MGTTLIYTKCLKIVLLSEENKLQKDACSYSKFLKQEVTSVLLTCSEGVASVSPRVTPPGSGQHRILLQASGPSACPGLPPAAL